jgi:hypothetical protein
MVTITRTVAVNVNETSGETPVVALVVTAVVVKERGQNVQPAVRAETELPGVTPKSLARRIGFSSTTGLGRKRG